MWPSLFPPGALSVSLLHHLYKIACIQTGCWSTSFHFNYVFQGPLSRCDCMVRQQKVGFQYMDLGKYKSSLIHYGAKCLSPGPLCQTERPTSSSCLPAPSLPPSLIILYIVARITADTSSFPPSLPVFLFPPFLPPVSSPFLFSLCLSFFRFGDRSQYF